MSYDGRRTLGYINEEYNEGADRERTEGYDPNCLEDPTIDSQQRGTERPSRFFWNHEALGDNRKYNDNHTDQCQCTRFRQLLLSASFTTQ